MQDLEVIPQTYEEAVDLLAAWHAAGEGDRFTIYSFDDPRRQTVRLLEVSDEFLASGDVHPWTFGSSELYPFQSSVAQITRAEWDRVVAGELALPEGWHLNEARRVHV